MQTTDQFGLIIPAGDGHLARRRIEDNARAARQSLLERDMKIVVRTKIAPQEPTEAEKAQAVDNAKNEAMKRTIALYREVLPLKPLSVASILTMIADASGVTESQIKSGMRSRAFVLPRHAVFWLAHRYVEKISLPIIGRHMGNRDHTTILSGIRSFQAKIDARDPRIGFFYPVRETVFREVERLRNYNRGHEQ